MPQPRFEVPSGAIDGANTTFVLSAPYKAGSTAVFHNGLLLEPSQQDGWVESNPGAGVITMKEAPSGLQGDLLQVFFIDTSPILPETIITALFGTFAETGQLAGDLVLSDLHLQGTVAGAGDLSGALDKVLWGSGAVQAVQSLSGSLELCG